MSVEIVSNPERRRAQGGFALVIALSLMAFVLLLLLSITTLVRVESQSASISAARVEARQVALLGLKVALGELQQSVGPDQRVTARADLITDGSGDPAADLSRQYLTGVWNTETGNFDRWLASVSDARGFRDDSGLRSEDDISNAAVGPEQVSLFKVTNDPTSDVVVDKVYLGDSTRKYAFWIADEGVKAKVNLVASEAYYQAVEALDETATALRAPLGAAPSIGVDLLTEFAPIAGQKSADSAFRGALRKLTGSKDYEMLGLAQEDVSALSHDVTTVSYGLLTNAKSGGLKGDLSLGFENGNIGDGYVFTESGYAHPEKSLDVRGPSWAVFKDHYNLYKQMSYSNGIPRIDTNEPVAHGSLTGNDARNFYKNRDDYYDIYKDATVFDVTQAGAGSPATGFDLPRAELVQRQPVFLGSMVVVSMVNQGGKLVTILNPVGILWNPYNVGLRLQDDAIMNVPMRFGIEYKFNDQDPSKPAYKGRMETTVPLNMAGSPGYDGCDFVVPSGELFEPGEIKLYSVDQADLIGQPSQALNELNTVGGYGYYLRSWLTNLGDYRFNQINQSSQYDSAGLDMPEAGETIQIAITPMNTNVHETSYRPSGSSDLYYQRKVLMTAQMHALDHTSGTEGSFSVYGANDGEKDGRVFFNTVNADTLSNPTPVGIYFYVANAADNVNNQLATSSAIESHLCSNPRAFFSSSLHGTYLQLRNNPYTIYEPQEFIGSSTLSGLFFDDQYAHYGVSYNNAGDGQNRPVAWEFPTAPLTSLAQLQHVFFNSDGYEPSYAVGNSFASPYLRRDESISTVGPIDMNAYVHASVYVYEDWYGSAIDFSYLLNEALWDDYFFSSIAPGYENGTEQRDLDDTIDGFVSGANELINPRMKRYISNSQSAPTVADSLKQVASNPERSVAANLMVEGAFNVNSTSETAWKTFLGSLYGQQVVGMELADIASGGGSDLEMDSNTTEAVFSRLTLPTLDKSYPRGSSNIQNNEGSGYRSLDSAELDALAREVVKQVRKRGPFLSLSEFVNRKLVAAPDSDGLMGPLQQAINDAGLNDAYDLGLAVNKGGSASTACRHDVFLEPEAGTGNSYGAGLGYLLQGDVLNALGPYLTVKSNTFVIRSYGEVEDSMSGNTVTAYYEAVVQQVPDFVDSANAADAPTTSLNEANRNFGRKFKVVQIRELSPSEI